MVSNNICDLIDEARSACLFARARANNALIPTARQVLELATLGGARVLGVDQLVGSLDPGKQADLCTVDLSALPVVPVADPEAALVFSTFARDVSFTMVAGQTLFDRGQARTLNEAEIRQAAFDVTQRIFPS